MKTVIYIVIGTSLLFSTNIESLEKEKKEYKEKSFQKKMKISKKQVKEDNKLIIIFNTIDKEEQKAMEKKYKLLLKSSIMEGEICIYENTSSLTLSKLMSELSKHYTSINKISKHKKYNFHSY